MKPPELILNSNESQAIDIVGLFLNKQRALVGGLKTELGENIDVFSLRKCAPKMIDALDATWSVAVHGVGVGFTNTTTGEVIDVHAGLFDAPDAFDAWRIEQYAESIHSDLKDIGLILEHLASKSVVLRHPSLANHYELPVSFGT